MPKFFFSSVITNSELLPPITFSLIQPDAWLILIDLKSVPKIFFFSCNKFRIARHTLKTLEFFDLSVVETLDTFWEVSIWLTPSPKDSIFKCWLWIRFEKSIFGWLPHQKIQFSNVKRCFGYILRSQYLVDFLTKRFNFQMSKDVSPLSGGQSEKKHTHTRTSVGALQHTGWIFSLIPPQKVLRMAKSQPKKWKWSYPKDVKF